MRREDLHDARDDDVMSRQHNVRLLASLLVACVLCLGVTGSAFAHALAPSLLELREVENGRFDVLWRTPRLRPAGVNLQPRLPLRCVGEGEAVPGAGATDLTLRWQIDCGEAGIVGSILAVDGLDRSRTATLLRVIHRDGRKDQLLLDGENPSWQVEASGVTGSVFASYLRLGFDHILEGLDHLLFVLGLLFLIRGGRRLFAAVTSFTVGHSVTLALAALDIVRFPSSLVEVGIALSLVVVALELCDTAHAETSRIRRNPWTIAFVFGLLHGLGFAGALREIGLPSGEIPMALLSFNIGIELGQLTFIALMLLVGFVAARPLAWVRSQGSIADRLPGYAIGSCAMYWVFERGVAALL
jgi:hypothetical protein